MKIFGREFSSDEIMHDLGIVGLGVVSLLGLNVDQVTTLTQQVVDLVNTAISHLHQVSWGGIALMAVKLLFHNSDPVQPPKAQPPSVPLPPGA